MASLNGHPHLFDKALFLLRFGGLGINDGGQPLSQPGFGLWAVQFIDQLPLEHEFQAGQGLHAKLTGEHGLLIHIDARQQDLALIFINQAVQNRSHLLAGLTASRPEIDNHRYLPRLLQDLLNVLFGGFKDVAVLLHAKTPRFRKLRAIVR